MGVVRSPGRKRPRLRVRADTSDADLGALAQRVTYEGSAEHKRHPSPAGPPALRSDASECPKLPFSTVESWLRSAIEAGHVGTPWEGEFPRYVWVANEEGFFEGRLTNRDQGIYKG